MIVTLAVASPTGKASPGWRSVHRHKVSTRASSYWKVQRPEWLGACESLPSSGTVEMTYRVKGDESAPQENTFTIEDSEASYDKEEAEEDVSVAVSARLDLKIAGHGLGV